MKRNIIGLLVLVFSFSASSQDVMWDINFFSPDFKATQNLGADKEGEPIIFAMEVAGVSRYNEVNDLGGDFTHGWVARGDVSIVSVEPGPSGTNIPVQSGGGTSFSTGMDIGGGYGINSEKLGVYATLNHGLFYYSSFESGGETTSASDFFPEKSFSFRLNANWRPFYESADSKGKSVAWGLHASLRIPEGGGDSGFLIGFVITPIN